MKFHKTIYCHCCSQLSVMFAIFALHFSSMEDFSWDSNQAFCENGWIEVILLVQKYIALPVFCLVFAIFVQKILI